MYKLLIVDDEVLERQAIRKISETQCAEFGGIYEAGDGDSAVAVAREQRPDMIVMDIRIPVISGLEATRQIRSFLPESQIIILTAFDEFNYARQAVSLGAAEYLLKPVRTVELVKVFQQSIEKFQRRREKDLKEVELFQQVNKAKPFIQMAFVQELLSGYFDDLTPLREQAAVVGMRNDPGMALVLGGDYLQQLVHQDGKMSRQLVTNHLSQKIGEAAGANALVMPVADGRLAVVLGVASGKPYHEIIAFIRQKVENIYKAMGSEFGATVTIGVGRYYPDAREVYKSYLEAMTAYQQGFFMEDNPIIFFDELPSQSSGPFIYPFRNERSVLEDVRCGDTKAAKEKLKLLLEEVFQSKTNIDMVKSCVLELLIVLSRAAVEGGASLDKMTLRNFNLINRLVDCRNQSQIQQLLMDYLDNFMDNMLDNRNTVNTRVVNQACSFILTNCNRNITLEDVAQTVHLSPFYFSRIFKKEQGCNFVEFLTKSRVERAKKLLHKTDLSIVRIALECGYQDASYFCKVFRQLTEVTPNQFRSQSCHKPSPAEGR
ncbi:MAG: two component transcriptional regulator, AraC family [Firmicutes bacterium]|nr:two component transcriptional regulator, AraC family [Bacillota bacterium]